jgi:hypothetical protein
VRVLLSVWLEGFCKGQVKVDFVDDFGVWIDLFGIPRFKVWYGW